MLSDDIKSNVNFIEDRFFSQINEMKKIIENTNKRPVKVFTTNKSHEILLLTYILRHYGHEVQTKISKNDCSYIDIFVK